MAEPDLMEEGEIVDDDEDVQTANDAVTAAAASSSSTVNHDVEHGLLSSNQRYALDDDDYAIDNDDENNGRENGRLSDNNKLQPYDDEIDEDELMGGAIGVHREVRGKKRALLENKHSGERRPVITFRSREIDGTGGAAGGLLPTNFKRQRQRPDDDGSSEFGGDEPSVNAGNDNFVPVNNQRFTKRPCKFWLRGNCKDAYCTFPHENPNNISNLRGNASSSAGFDRSNSSGNGESTANGFVNKGSAGQVASGGGGNEERKYEPCKYYLLGGCWRGPKCPYLHGDFPCKFFHTGAKCHKGFKCRFSHAMPLAPEYRQALFDYLSKDQAGGGDKYASMLLMKAPASNNANNFNGQQQQSGVTPPKFHGSAPLATAAATTGISPSKGKRSPPPLPNAPRRVLLTPEDQQQLPQPPKPADDVPAVDVPRGNGPVVFPAPPSIFLERLASVVNDGKATPPPADPRNRTVSADSSVSTSTVTSAESDKPKTEVALRRSPPPSKVKSKPAPQVVTSVPQDAKPVAFSLPSTVRSLLPTPDVVFSDGVVDKNMNKRNSRVVQNDDEDEDGVADGLKPPSRTLSRRSPPLENSTAPVNFSGQTVIPPEAAPGVRLHEQPDARWAIDERRATVAADSTPGGSERELRPSGRKTRFGPALDSTTEASAQFPPPPPALVAHLNLNVAEEPLPAAARGMDTRRSFENLDESRLPYNHPQTQQQQFYPNDSRALPMHLHRVPPLSRFDEHYGAANEFVHHCPPHDERPPMQRDISYNEARKEIDYNVHNPFPDPRDRLQNNHFAPAPAADFEYNRQYMPPLPVPDTGTFPQNPYAPPNLMHNQAPPRSLDDNHRFYGSRFPPNDYHAEVQQPPHIHPGDRMYAQQQQPQFYDQRPPPADRFQDDRSFDAGSMPPREVFPNQMSQDGRREFGGQADFRGAAADTAAPVPTADPRRRAAATSASSAGDSSSAGINMPDLNSVVEALQKRLGAASGSNLGGGAGGLHALLPSLTIVTPTFDASFEMLPEGAVAQWNLEEFDDLAATNADNRMKVAQKFLRRSQKSTDELQADPRLRNVLVPESIIHADRERRLSEADDREEEERNRLQLDMDHFSYRVLEDLQRKKKQQMHSIIEQHHQHAKLSSL